MIRLELKEPDTVNPLMASFSRRATLEWTGDVVRGSGHVAASSGAFSVGATFPRLAGEPRGLTAPEELLAASHAACFGIGLRSVLAKHGGSATALHVTSTVTARKGNGEIRLESAHLDAIVTGMEGVAPAALEQIGHEAEHACTISTVLRATVPVTGSVLVRPDNSIEAT